jgi:hypothetical protein
VYKCGRAIARQIGLFGGSALRNVRRSHSLVVHVGNTFPTPAGAGHQ